ncbi:PH domain-containing protein [Brachybacterium hainanense]|uniref:PH domain-containing protein n=1 Tax=Brachybacterium hainanense TaxID=1541174 RepID=A0ABV6RAR7_9MICO
MSAVDPAEPRGEEAEPRDEEAVALAVPESAQRRTHPLTPFISGWKIILAIVAALSIQNITALVNEFTMSRLLIGLGILAVVIVVSIAVSALSWRFLTYAITPEGVLLRSGVLTRTRRFAPREKIDSVSVERPLSARVLGLAKVRVEIAGGGESHLDIAYVRSADAERMREEILVAARAADPEAAPPLPDVDPAAPGREAPGAPAWDAVLLDGVSDGERISQVPTARLLHSMIRDVSFLIGAFFLLVGMIVAVALLLWDRGPGMGAIIAMVPALIAVPKLVFGRIEAGWGFVSRITDRGLRLRRGLLNTRTDNVPSGRIQELALSQPALWRSRRWARATVTVAGIDDSDTEGSLTVLPVGTPEELRLTLGHLLPPLGTADDDATLAHLLTARARDIDGMRPPRRWQWIARRTEVVVLLPGYVVRRSGILTRTVQLVARDRIQGITVSEGPIERRCGLLSLAVPVAGTTLNASGMPRDQVLALREPLARDAARLRRYRDRAHWPLPPLAAGGAR